MCVCRQCLSAPVLILMAIRGPAVLDAPIGEDAAQGDAVLVEEGHHPIIEQIGGGVLRS